MKLSKSRKSVVEIVSSYVRRRRSRCLFVLDGPAVAIFERKLGPIARIGLDEAIDRASSVLCGTSWPADLEVSALRLARDRGRKSVAFLDHWINYRERFVRGGRSHLPDEIWVGDDEAASLAHDAFPGLPVTVVENPYMLDVQDALRALPPRRPDAAGDGLNVLYATEPTSEIAAKLFADPHYWGYSEGGALRFFFDNAGALGGDIARVVVRPHPSESPDKYAWAAEGREYPVMVRADRPLLDEIAASDVVVGCNSMAMVVGLWAGKRVVCSMPPEGRGQTLPHAAVERLSGLSARPGRSSSG